MIDSNKQRGLCPAIMHAVWSICAVITLAVSTLAGCASAPRTGTLEGTATYRERMLLPPDAVFEAVLQDISQADAQAVSLGRATIDPAGPPPFHFRISYSEAAIQPGRRYAVRASIRQGDRLLFTTDRVYPVFESDDEPLDMLLVSVKRGEPRSAVELELPASYAGKLSSADGVRLWHLDLLPEGRYQLRITDPDRPEPYQIDELGHWWRDSNTGRLELHHRSEAPVYFMVEDDSRILQKLDTTGQAISSTDNDRLQRLPALALIEPRLSLTGMFTYMADAPSIVLCDDQARLPVAMEGDYKALESAYLTALQAQQSQTNPALLVSLDGLIASRPSMEESLPPQRTLVVERFNNIWPRESCGQPLADSPLVGTYWKLVRLQGAPVQAAERHQEPHLIFAADEQRISGSGGCNRVMGGYQTEGDKLQFSQLAGTMKACLSGMEQEQRFLQSLNTVARYRIDGSHLEMLGANGEVIARFEAVALR